MSACCSSFACAADAQFGAARAQADLARYRNTGPDATTRALRDALRNLIRPDTSLLDVGAGIGALTHELLARTQASATVVEASSAYLRAARQEVERRGLAGRVTFTEGDFVAVAPRVPTADIVAMDRVVCCYPTVQPLLEAALARARRLFAYSYPRDRWYVRAVIAVENVVRRLRRNPFRTFVHPPAAMLALVAREGFRLRTRQRTVAWAIEVWERATTT